MRKILLFLLISLLGNFSIHAQNTCASPTVISSLPFSSGAQTTCGTVDDYGVGSYYTGNYGGGEDYVYSLSITNAPVTLKFDLGGAATWKILSVHSGCAPTTANAIGGVATSSGTTGTVTLNISTNGTYFLFIDTWPSPACGAFTLDIAVIPPCSTPSAQPTALNLTPTSGSIAGSFTAASPAPTNYLVVRTTTNTAPVPVNGTAYTLGASSIGFIQSVGTGTTFTATGLLPSTTYYFWVFSYNSTSGTCVPSYLLTSPLTNTGTTLVAGNITSTAIGGLWSSTATWVGGVLPTNGDNITIANGATVTIDGVYTVNGITVGQGTSGTLNWNASSNALTVVGNITIASGASFLAYTTGGTGQTINVGGNFTNNGYVNLAVGTTAGAGALLNFNGSAQSSSLNQVLGGTGTFEGTGTSGIIRALFFQTTGSSTISTSQNLITTSFAHTAGSLNTNGKLTIDNTVTVYGKPLNTQVASVAVTTMSTTVYSNAPVVFGGSVTLWTAGGAATLNTRYFSGNNVYIATTAGTFDGSTAPTHTAGSVTNGTVPLLWVGTLGTIGNPFIQTAVTVGTQYFYGNNLYTCTAAGTPSAAAPPVHTTGAVVSGTTATFLYVGTPASVTVNYDVTAQNVRSLNLTNAGSGYSSAPSIAFSLNGGTGAGAAATAVVFQSIGYGTNSLTQSSGGSALTGGLTINSTAGASSFSGVGGLFTTGGGVGYTIAPTVGFSGPTNINFVTDGGSGYIAAPTITVTGGTLVSGTALTTSNFTITVAGGKVVSVYLATGTTATYSVPPTLAFSAGNATLAFPAGCWPTATATIGSNGQITNFNLTNAGFGYVAAPTVGFGATSGTSAGGTFITAATAPTARVALYNITYGWFSPAVSSTQNTSAELLPANGKMNAITVNSATGASIASNLELFASTPFTLTAGVLNFGANTVSCTNYSYAGASGSTTSSVSGRILLTTPGGSWTRTFPYDVPLAVATGTGSLATGSTVTTLAATRTAAPSGSVSGGVASITGSRAYRIQASAGSTYGTNPTVTLNYNATDALTTVNNADLLITQSAVLTGAWTVRSLSSGTGALSATGSRTTATSGVGPIVPTGDDYFAWATSLPCTGTPTTGVITGASDACVGGTVAFTSSTFSAGNGMTYRWQTSPDNVTWTNTAIITPATYSFTFATPIWVRRVDTCTNGNAFAISNAIQVSARAATLCYCGPNTATTIHSSNSNAINSVAITGTTLNNSNTGVGNTSTGYIEFPASGSTTATLLQSTSYDVVVTLASASIASVWFDWNRNGIYEATEWTQITTTGSGTITTTIAVPANASLGLTGMRVRTRGTGSPNASGDACTSFASGETEEYFITIAAPPACSGTPTAGTVTGPATAICPGTSFALTAAGFTNGLSGLTYRWQSSPDNTTWTNTTGTTPASFTTSVTSSTWFRLVDTCTNGNAFGVSNAVQVTVTSPSSLPVTEGFNASTSLPTCWSKVIVATQTASKITVVTTASNLTAAPQEGANFIMYNSYSSTGGSAGSEERLISLPVNTTGISSVDVRFQWYEMNGSLYNSGAYLNEGVTLEWSTDGTTWNTSTFFPRHVATASATGEWKSKVVTFPVGAGNQAALILAFKFRSEYGYNCYLDLVDVAATGTLPVTITSFKGERQGINNLLSWTTATEVNNAGFQLQRSADGVNFTTLAYVDSKAPNGNSSAALTYNFTDVKPLIGSGYYRLKQLDKDGKATLSEVVLIKGVKPSKLELVSVYPNPVINVLNVSIAAVKADKVTFIVSDITGKTIISKVMNVVSGDNLLPIDVANLANGTYTVKAICADGCETAIKKFVKQ